MYVHVLSYKAFNVEIVLFLASRIWKSLIRVYLPFKLNEFVYD